MLRGPQRCALFASIGALACDPDIAARSPEIEGTARSAIVVVWDAQRTHVEAFDDPLVRLRFPNLSDDARVDAVLYTRPLAELFLNPGVLEVADDGELLPRGGTALRFDRGANGWVFEENVALSALRVRGSAGVGPCVTTTITAPLATFTRSARCEGAGIAPTPPQAVSPPTPPAEVALDCGWSSAAPDACAAPEPPPRVDCADGEVQWRDADRCVPFGPPCPVDGWPDDLPLGAAVRWVHATGGSDPFGAAAYSTIADALIGAPEGVYIALSRGRHTLAELTRTATVVGACVAGTILQIGDVRGDAALRRLTLEGGATVHQGARLSARQLSLRDGGLRVRGILRASDVVSRGPHPALESDAGGSIAVDRAAIERSAGGGIAMVVSAGAELNASNVAVRAEGGHALGATTGGIAKLAQVTVFGGVVAVNQAASVRFEELVLRGDVSTDDLHVDGATLTGARLDLERRSRVPVLAREGAFVSIEGARIAGERIERLPIVWALPDSEVRIARASLTTHGGSGLVVAPGGSAKLTHTSIEEASAAPDTPCVEEQAAPAPAVRVGGALEAGPLRIRGWRHRSLLLEAGTATVSDLTADVSGCQGVALEQGALRLERAVIEGGGRALIHAQAGALSAADLELRVRERPAAPCRTGADSVVDERLALSIAERVAIHLERARIVATPTRDCRVAAIWCAHPRRVAPVEIEDLTLAMTIDTDSMEAPTTVVLDVDGAGGNRDDSCDDLGAASRPPVVIQRLRALGTMGSILRAGNGARAEVTDVTVERAEIVSDRDIMFQAHLGADLMLDRVRIPRAQFHAIHASDMGTRLVVRNGDVSDASRAVVCRADASLTVERARFHDFGDPAHHDGETDAVFEVGSGCVTYARELEIDGASERGVLIDFEQRMSSRPTRVTLEGFWLRNIRTDAVELTPRMNPLALVGELTLRRGLISTSGVGVLAPRDAPLTLEGVSFVGVDEELLR